MNGHQIRNNLSHQLKGKPVGYKLEVSDCYFSEAFPKYRDLMKSLAIALGGGRPEETQLQIIDYFCAANHCDYYEGGLNGTHKFVKTKLDD